MLKYMLNANKVLLNDIKYNIRLTPVCKPPSAHQVLHKCVNKCVIINTYLWSAYHAMQYNYSINSSQFRSTQTNVSLHGA